MQKQPNKTKKLENIFNKYLFAFFVMVLGVSSCTNTFFPLPISTSSASLIVEDNSIIVVDNVNDSASLQVTVGDMVSYSIPIETNKKISSISILKGGKDYYNDLALILTKNNGTAKVNLSLPQAQDTTVLFRIAVDDTNQYSCEVDRGTCAVTSGIFDATNIESDIIKWLYRKHENTLNDSAINVMRLYLKQLYRTTYKEYVTTDEIPVVASLKGIDYKVSSDMIADHYYLFACTSEKDVEDFVEEMVSIKFESSTNSLDETMPCFRSVSTSGTACILLVGINNDWSFQIVPVGLICIDNVHPRFVESYPRPTPNIYSTFTFEKRQIRITSKQPTPCIDGSVWVGFGAFEGYGSMLDVPFTFVFSGDVKSIIVHRTKTSLEEIDLDGKKSPFHLTTSVRLNTGDNYIPIDAIDFCGNKTTYDLKISTESKDRNPVIENNIFN